MPFNLKRILALALLCSACAAALAGAGEAAGGQSEKPALQQSLQDREKSFLERQSALVCDYAKSRQKYLLACSEFAAIFAKDEISKKFNSTAAELGRDAKADIAKIALAVNSIFRDGECSAIFSPQNKELSPEALERCGRALNMFWDSFAGLIEIANKIPSLASEAKEILKSAPKEEEKLRLTDAVEPTIALGNQIVADLKSAKEVSAKLVKLAEELKLTAPKALSNFAK